MLDVTTKRKAILLIVLMIVVFGAVAGFLTVGVEGDAIASAGSLG